MDLPIMILTSAAIVLAVGLIVLIFSLLIHAIKDRDWPWIIFAVLSLLSVSFYWINNDIKIHVTYEEHQ